MNEEKKTPNIFEPKSHVCRHDETYWQRFQIFSFKNPAKQGYRMYIRGLNVAK